MPASPAASLVEILHELESAARSAEGTATIPFELTVDVARAVRGLTLPGESLRVVMIGGFNRGKSSLINRLLNDTLLPVSVLPETCLTMRLTGSPRTFAEAIDGTTGERIRLEPTGEGLSRETLQATLGERFDRIDEIVIGSPAPLLERLEIVDTPGLDEAFLGFDEQVAERLADADCVLLVVSATEPLSLQEFELLESLGSSAARPTTAIVLSMIDRLAGQDETERVAANVAARVRTAFPEAPLFPVSSRPDDVGAAELERFLNRLADASDRVRRLRVAGETRRVVGALIDRASSAADASAGEASDRQNPIVPFDPPAARRRVEAAARDCRLEAQAWMREFARRVDRDVLSSLRQTDPREVQRRFHYFLVDVFGQALQACVNAHRPRLIEALHEALPAAKLSTTIDVRREAAAQAIGVGLGEWVDSDSAGYTGGLLGRLADGIAPSWSHWVRSASSSLQFALGLRRPRDADATVGKEIRELSEAGATIASFLESRIESTYLELTRDLLAAFDEEAQRQEEALESARRSTAAAALSARQGAERLREDARRLRERLLPLAERLAVVHDDLVRDLDRRLGDDLESKAPA